MESIVAPASDPEPEPGQNWWEAKYDRPGGPGIKVNTPDPAKYHQTTKGVMLPHARPDGTSMGIGDVNKPKTLNVIDVLNPENNVSVDLTRVTKDTVAAAFSGGSGLVGYGSEESKGAARDVYRSLSQSQLQPPSPPAVAAAPLQAPAASAVMNPVPVAPRIEPPMSSLPSAPSPAPALTAESLKLLMTLTPEVVAHLNALTATVAAPVAISVMSPSPQPSPLSVRVETGIACIDNGVKKPAVQATFDMGRTIGKLTARYHDAAVGEGNSCIVLVYDNRYEEGQQYTPPDLGPDQPVMLTLQYNGTQRTLEVRSIGMVFTLGCLTCIVMVPVADSLPPAPSE